ncbi:MAG: SDR family NAD(P)-dependent oxidoreductase [Actinomycetota bacterium]|nr:SDR family NAD(P)-dependent oxidoreductase [Actinomycetota bacterium]
MLITGGSAGIGERVASGLVQLGANLTIVARRQAVAGEAARRIAGDHAVDVMLADLSLLKGVRSLAQEFQSRYDGLDALVHCAGGLTAKRTLTAEGAELTYATQYLARQYLDTLLMPAMAGRDARIVSVSGGGDVKKALDQANLHGEVKYSGLGAMQTISIANDLLGLEIAERFRSAGVRSYVYGPGPVRGTGLTSQLKLPIRVAFDLASHVIGSTVEGASRDIIALLTGDHPSGLYQRRLKAIEPTAYAASARERDAVWRATEAEIDRLTA